jgi:hypothetical protein
MNQSNMTNSNQSGMNQSAGMDMGRTAARDMTGDVSPAALPLMQTYVPAEIMSKATSSYGKALYAVTQVKSATGTNAYHVTLLNNGQTKSEFIDEGGAVVANVFRTAETDAMMNANNAGMNGNMNTTPSGTTGTTTPGQTTTTGDNSANAAGNQTNNTNSGNNTAAPLNDAASGTTTDGTNTTTNGTTTTDATANPSTNAAGTTDATVQTPMRIALTQMTIVPIIRR